jgi:hypothetical protein
MLLRRQLLTNPLRRRIAKRSKESKPMAKESSKTVTSSKRFKTAGRSKAEINRAGELISLEQFYGKPTFVKIRIRGNFLYGTWCMEDGSKIDGIETSLFQKGGGISFVAVVYSPEYLAAQKGKTRLGVFRSASCPGDFH